jgi:tRNA 2-thiouridine synthesizing protein A
VSEALIDARGMRCPWPALRLARALRDGEAALIVADDPAAPREITALAGERGWSVAAVDTLIGPGWRVIRSDMRQS